MWRCTWIHTHTNTNVHCGTLKKPNMRSDLAEEARNCWRTKRKSVVMQTGRWLTPSTLSPADKLFMKNQNIVPLWFRHLHVLTSAVASLAVCMWVWGFINDEKCWYYKQGMVGVSTISYSQADVVLGWKQVCALQMFLTYRCNVRPGAAADPACVSGWTKRSCPQRAGELLRPLDSSPPQPMPPGEHAACLNKERRGKGGKAQRRERNGKTELTWQRWWRINGWGKEGKKERRQELWGREGRIKTNLVSSCSQLFKDKKHSFVFKQNVLLTIHSTSL